ncbi:alcohol dehydrogenase catalytic domain-containing protein [Streptomyces sp. RKAG337]|uniref:alcohol dehydrogenase catalytic domain-containing protein n=1 Tax=Streptomyces sp. RKAG337 TaxID=2893404 RepID=UPI0035A94073
MCLLRVAAALAAPPDALPATCDIEYLLRAHTKICCVCGSNVREPSPSQSDAVWAHASAGTSPLRSVLGHEIAGEVFEGPRNAGPTGDRVLALYYGGCGQCPACQAGMDTLCPAHAAEHGFDSDSGPAPYFPAEARCPSRSPRPSPSPKPRCSAAPAPPRARWPSSMPADPR